jgi:predicted ester cyclase
MKHLVFFAFTSLLIFSSCNSNKTKDEAKMDDQKKDGAMTNDAEAKEERNRQTIMASFDAFNKGDIDKAFENADPSYMDSFDGSGPAMPADSVKVMFKAIMAAMPDYKGSNFEYIADGNKVIVLADWSGTFKNDLMGMKATGKSFSFKDADIFTFNDNGKLIGHRSITNFGNALMGSGK